MRRMHLLIVAVALLAVPFTAQAQTCFWYSCDYIENGNMESTTYWSYALGTSWDTISDPCLSGAPSTTVVSLQNSEWLSQQLTINDSATTWELEFSAYLIDDTENWYDQLKVTVTNLDTNQAETLYLHGNSFDMDCNVVMPLQNDYSNSDVYVEFENAWLATGTYQIDNVSLWGHNFP